MLQITCLPNLTLHWQFHFFRSYIIISLDNCLVSQAEMPCVLLESGVFKQKKNTLCHKLGFSIRRGLLCYLESYSIDCSWRLLPYSEFSCTSSSSISTYACKCVCAGVCVHLCVIYGIFHLWVYFLQEVRSGLMIWISENEWKEI
jgi:hypothetical protein